MDLPLTYNFCKTNKIALINEANTSILHTCGSLKPTVLSSIENLLLDKIEKKNHTDDEFESYLLSYIQINLMNTTSLIWMI